MKPLGGGASAPQKHITKSRTEVLPPYTQGGGALAPLNDRLTCRTEVPPPKRVNLPHIDLKGHYQFVTFRTHDSIDDFLKRLSAENLSANIRQYKIDKYLDHSSNGCYLNTEALILLKSFFLEKDKELYELIAFSVMPNHVHILFKQYEELAKIMQLLKGSSAYQLNRLLERKGKFWEDGYYDKLIRNEDHFSMTYEYIKYNAVKAGLTDSKERFYGIYE